MYNKHGKVVYNLSDEVAFSARWKAGLCWVLMIVIMLIAGVVSLVILIQDKF